MSVKCIDQKPRNFRPVPASTRTDSLWVTAALKYAKTECTHTGAFDPVPLHTHECVRGLFFESLLIC